jgi:hypothetical protein
MFFGLPGAAPIKLESAGRLIEFEFTADNDAHGKGTLHFRFGAVPGEVFLDNIRVVDAASGKDVAPVSDFESGPDSIEFIPYDVYKRCPIEGRHTNSLQSVDINPILAYPVCAMKSDMGKRDTGSGQGHQPEALANPLLANLFCIESAGTTLEFCDYLFDKRSLPRPGPSGEQIGRLHRLLAARRSRLRLPFCFYLPFFTAMFETSYPFLLFIVYNITPIDYKSCSIPIFNESRLIPINYICNTFHVKQI